MSMTSRRPYLIRAIYDWIGDNEKTPYILVNAKYPDVHLPEDQVGEDGTIVLNVSYSAVRDFLVGDDALSFNGSFGGVACDIYVPIEALMAIYAAENGQGVVFESEAVEPPKLDSPEDPSASKIPEAQGKPKKGKPTLKVVK